MIEDYENATVQSLSVLASMGFQIITKNRNDLTEKLKELSDDYKL